MTIRDACSAQAAPTADLAATIVALDGETWEYTVGGVLNDQWQCDLAAVHSGPHMTHVQTTPDHREFWLRWLDVDADVELVEAPICEGELALGGDDSVMCLLPDMHEGAHYSGELAWTS